ncbi:MAG: 6-phosphofructokinase [Bacteroidetes bacterium GWF2_43_63]|nr:MAG: 6-phosphofructokinase [Bacteroidetes bacterium GWE2_42_42]OFY56227.1 MAG: 6-phosphofructokinase [Bacteroidetes bacterium GWF2_43_63]HBG71899.1 6-phosphofructokinase [Bacteroidales bacterium]HCB61800.1 6-phosphofructokinase [Bacteroidales bacterium]HCY23822.1 6-phosphofructokinase [Bacteroidales bacterium]
MNSIKRIGVLTSGGDAPGMNAAIRAVTRTAIFHGLQVTGIRRGYQGMVEGDFIELETKSVANIIQRGGTILKTARSKDFMTKEGMNRAYNSIKMAGIDALVVIGGDGTFRGAHEFTSIYKDVKVVGIAGTIDNDLAGTDNCIGYDTALNTVVEAVDKIRDTADSHERLFFIEVMGRDAGFIALRSGIAVGAEDILIPETSSSIDELIDKLENGRRRNKTSGIIMIAEGDESGGAFAVAEQVKKRLPQYDVRVTVLGHIQRGGSPSCMDRVYASQYGYHAVKALLSGKSGIMVGIIKREVVETPFGEAVKHTNKVRTDLKEMIRTLSV